MAQMIRKQVYIEPHQDKSIKQRARKLGITEAEVIRRAIDGETAVPPFRIRDIGAWDREKAFIARRVSGGGAPPSRRRFQREEIYEERLSRYGR
jgi:hypothetical protein